MTQGARVLKNVKMTIKFFIFKRVKASLLQRCCGIYVITQNEANITTTIHTVCNRRT